jgi:hypothetical protein
VPDEIVAIPATMKVAARESLDAIVRSVELIKKNITHVAISNLMLQYLNQNSAVIAPYMADAAKYKENNEVKYGPRCEKAPIRKKKKNHATTGIKAMDTAL